MHPEGEEGHGGQHESRLKARPVQRARQRAAEHGGHEQPRQEEAHADELGRRQHVDGVFITTKANPQIMVAANSMSLYTKPGYVSSQSQPAIIVRPFAFRQVTASQRGRNGILLTGVGVHGGRMMVGKR